MTKKEVKKVFKILGLDLFNLAKFLFFKSLFVAFIVVISFILNSNYFVSKNKIKKECLKELKTPKNLLKRVKNGK